MEMNQIKELTDTFEDLKHTDDNGNEYWNARELSKALGYSEYRWFKPAIERAVSSLESSGKNSSDHFEESLEMVEIGSGAEREVESYKMSRYGAYLTAINSDVSKPEVALAQQYFLVNGRKYEVIAQRMLIKDTLDKRNMLRDANKSLTHTIKQHDVKDNEIGIVMNAGDEGFFNMSTKEVKEQNNIPKNKPIADYMSNRVAAYKAVAQYNTESEVENKNAQGVNEVSQVAFDENRLMRNMFTEKFKGNTPENSLITEDVKKIERQYNKETKQLLDNIEKNLLEGNNEIFRS